MRSLEQAIVCLLGWSVGWFLNVLDNYLAISWTGSKTEVWKCYVLSRTIQRGETMTSVSAGGTDEKRIESNATAGMRTKKLSEFRTDLYLLCLQLQCQKVRT